jgi:hypothetical protein
MKSEFPQELGYISLERTDDSARSDHILALGRKLVEELGLEPSVDTLGRWMAHHVADLIVGAESATGEEKRLADEHCFEAILTLWKHRAELPNGRRPFEALEPVVRSLESLDPDNDTPRYFRSARPPKGADEKDSEAGKWLAIADGLDYSAKILIGYCLAEAARAALDKSKQWVKLAEAAGAKDGVSEIVVRFISTTADIGNEPGIDAEARQQLQNRLNRLEAFTKLAKTFANNLRKQLEGLPPEKENDSGTA